MCVAVGYDLPRDPRRRALERRFVPPQGEPRRSGPRAAAGPRPPPGVGPTGRPMLAGASIVRVYRDSDGDTHRHRHGQRGGSMHPAMGVTETQTDTRTGTGTATGTAA